MNYRNIYTKIIRKANSENRVKHDGTYYEEHHIKPKCLGGTNDINNKVLLTAKEHYLCHKLLTFMYPKNEKIVMAYFRMTFSKSQGVIRSANDYQFARELMSTTPKSIETKKKISENHSHYFKGKHLSEDHKKNIGKAGLNRKATPEARQNIAKSKIGITLSEEHCENIRKSKIGKNNPNFGIPRTETTKLKIQKANKGKISSRKGKSLLQIKIEKYGEIEGTLQYNEWIEKLKFKAKNRL